MSDPATHAQHLSNQIAREEARLRSLTTYTVGVRFFRWLGIVLLATSAFSYAGSSSPRLTLALAAAGILGWLTGFFFSPLVAYYRDETQAHIASARAELETMKRKHDG